MFAVQRPNSPFSFVLLALELTPLLFNIWNTLRQLFFCTHILLLFVIVTKGHMTFLNASLDVANFNQADTHAYFRFIHKLNSFYSEHWRMLSFARHVNSHVISQLMGVIFVSNITINLVIVGSLLFRRLYISESLIMLVLITLQTSFAIITCLSMTSWSECFYQSDSLLYRAQLNLATTKVDQLYKRALVSTAKLKLMVFFETVCTSKKFHFTMGSLGKISHQTLYEFIFVYSSLVFYVAKMIRRGRL